MQYIIRAQCTVFCIPQCNAHCDFTWHVVIELEVISSVTYLFFISLIRLTKVNIFTQNHVIMQVFCIQKVLFHILYIYMFFKHNVYSVQYSVVLHCKEYNE